MQGITLYLGTRCNMGCPYCHREGGEKEPELSGAFLDRLRGRTDVRIKFMGGEPTLYMDAIRRVVDAAPGAEYAIATNGKTLFEHLDFFRAHRFLVCVSYDGTDLRGFDPFTRPIDYPWLAVSCTLYHGNTDFKKITQKFAEKERVIGRSLSFFPHIVHYTSPANAAFALTREDYDFIFDQYRECLGRFFSDAEKGVLNLRYQGLFTQLERRAAARYSFGETYCVNRGLAKTDASGQAYSCLYIRDEALPADGWQAAQAAIIRRKFPKCETCPVYDMCGAACIKSIDHDEECRFYKKLYSWFRSKYFG